MTRSFSLNALRLRQSAGVELYVFGIDGRLIQQIATVDIARRPKDSGLKGYQREKVRRHILDIYEYLSRDNAMLPNAIVLAFDSRVKFTPIPGVVESDWATFGKFSVPVPATGAESRPAFIVDGQQRVAALSSLDPKKSFPVVVVGFVAPTEATQREQFLLVNKTRPLPRDLVNEILPGVTIDLPKSLRLRHVAASVAEQLRLDSDSPFFRRIRSIGSKGEESANVSVAAVIAVVENSVKKKGVLFDVYSGGHAKRDMLRGVAQIMKTFYDGVRRTWPDAWDGSPQTSRLVHGVGIVGLGHVMDRVMAGIDPQSPKARAAVANRLAKFEKRCAWTKGRWPAPLSCSWNELQNTSQDKARLSEFLLRELRDK